MKKVIGSLAVMCMLFYACTKSSGNPEGGGDPNNPDPPAGGNTCDTANVTYMGIVPILQGNCYSCHGASTNSGSNGIVLEGHSNLKRYAESGELIGVITHAQGFEPMPKDGPKLPDCSINKIRSWIDNGMQNN